MVQELLHCQYSKKYLKKNEPLQLPLLTEEDRKAVEKIKSIQTGNSMNQVRVDKWLWSIRLFKSRTIATDACKEGKVKLGESYLKPSHEIKTGDLLYRSYSTFPVPVLSGQLDKGLLR